MIETSYGFFVGKNNFPENIRSERIPIRSKMANTTTDSISSTSTSSAEIHPFSHRYTPSVL